MRRAGLGGLVFLSGFAALVYELVWQRLLNLVFGVSTLSVSAVLAAFMGGLALGSLAVARTADRTRRPLLLYGWLQAAIGVTALLVPWGFEAVTSLYPALHATLEPGPWGGVGLRLVLALAVLIVPATLLGATMPVMGRLALTRSARVVPTFSWFYGVNTLGGVAGASLTGFALLRFLGMRHTLWVAASLNLLVALGAGVLHRCGQSVSATTTDPEPPTGSQTLPGARTRSSSDVVPLLLAAVTGAVTIGFEVAWTRVLGILTSNSAYGFALILTVLLLGLGVGSLVHARWSRRPGDPWRRLALSQWLLAVIMLVTLPYFRTAPGWLDGWCNGQSPGVVFTGELALTAAALLAPAILMGMGLPLLMAGMTGAAERFGASLGRLYAANTLGGVAGPFVAGFVLIPWLGIHATFGVLITGVLLVGTAAWCRMAVRPPNPLVRFGGAGLVLGAAAAGWAVLPRGVYQKAAVTEPRHLVYYREGDNATVSVVEEGDAVRSIFVDGQPVAGTAGTSVVDQKMLAHLPLLLHPAPRRALTVGFGSGGTSHSMTLHGVAVDCVEIEAGVPAAADLFRSQNDGVSGNPDFRLILDDARSWLRVAQMPYDVIVTDCTNIQYRSNGDLYTVDYFRLMKERLNPDGLAAAWVPANGIRDDDLRTLLRSFRVVFPHASVWFMNTLPTDFLIVVGTPEVLEIDLEQLRSRMSCPGVREDLAAVGLADPLRLAYTFLAGDEELAAYLGDGDVNTDDRPVLSYTTYGATFRPTVAGNLVRLLARRGDVRRYVRHPADEATMLRHFAASNEAILGHVAHLVGSEAGALAQYARGAKLLPDDAAFRALVGSTYLRLRGAAAAGEEQAAEGE